MKVIIILIIIALLTILAEKPVLALDTEFGIESGKKGHNFSHKSWLKISEICRVCHVLHNETAAIKRYMNGLLWTRKMNKIVFPLYHSSWGAANALTRYTDWTSPITGRQGNLPDGLSKLCLSCHDGIIAPDVFKLHHFVSVVYDPEKTILREPLSKEMGVSGTISEVLDNGLVQCTSCHDVHGRESLDNASLLREKIRKICKVCHNVNIN